MVARGHKIKFAILEKLEVTGKREEGDGIWRTKVVDHAPTGNLELRMGDFTYGRKLRDRKRDIWKACWPDVWVASANGPSTLGFAGALAGRRIDTAKRAPIANNEITKSSK